MLDDSNWDVPTFNTARWKGKTTKYCTVIPVINEGNRIASLLKRMAELRIPALTDIIIIDGGSNDGSLADELLDSCNVAGLLVKTGPGKLSAQLRCAYAFAMREGYEGIVTIDGNDKDDPAAIPEFVKALDSSYDFIQGSRFVTGGVAVNTPLSRDLAIRFIHAPLLRVFSGFKWTDTTQGFRAYSRKMLLARGIEPFREQFSTYELLAYLSYRAPKQGFKCLEIGTSRRYPEGEVPTKISSFKGNLSVMTILIKSCLGHYNPPAR